MNMYIVYIHTDRIRLTSFWDDFGIILGSCRDNVGIILKSFWHHVGFMLALFGLRVGIIWGYLLHHVGIILDSFWDQFRISEASFWVHFWDYVGVTAVSSRYWGR